MLTLIRKDLRLLRPVLVGLTVLAVFLFGVLPASIACSWAGERTREMAFGRTAFGTTAIDFPAVPDGVLGFTRDAVSCWVNLA